LGQDLVVQLVVLVLATDLVLVVVVDSRGTDQDSVQDLVERPVLDFIT
jgi:hypothetical protein